MEAGSPRRRKVWPTPVTLQRLARAEQELIALMATHLGYRRQYIKSQARVMVLEKRVKQRPRQRQDVRHYEPRNDGVSGGGDVGDVIDGFRQGSFDNIIP